MLLLAWLAYQFSLLRRYGLAARAAPHSEPGSLFDGQKGIDENSIPLTKDECRRCGNPGPLLLARRQVADEALAIRH
jgi:hypothetical protein